MPDDTDTPERPMRRRTAPTGSASLPPPRWLAPAYAAAFAFLAVPAASGAEQTQPLEGQWAFVDDGSVVGFAPCSPPSAAGVCATLVVLPPDLAKLDAAARARLCSLPIMSALVPDPDPARRRHLGWIVDTDELVTKDQPGRYRVRLLHTDDATLTLEVIAFGSVVERLRMKRFTGTAGRCDANSADRR